MYNPEAEQKKNNCQASYFQSTSTVENLVRHGEKKLGQEK